MTRKAVLLGAGAAAAAILAVTAWAAIDAPAAGAAPPFAFRDDFDAGLCTGSCAGAHWAIRQEVRGTVSAAPAPGRPGLALLAQAGPKSGGVAKAGIVHRSGPMPVGTDVRIAFDLYIPAATPIDSMQIVDLECATCGEGGNPGIRLYLRRGRLRIDRSKIGIEHAWTNDSAPTLNHDRWHRIEMQVRIAADDSGGARVLLDGQEVLGARGATILPLARAYADRIQIGITANSNPVPATLWFDAIAVSARRRPG